MPPSRNLGMFAMNEALARQALNLQSTDIFKHKSGDLFLIDKWSLVVPNTEIFFEWKGQTSSAKFINRGHIVMNGVSYKSCHEWVRSVKQGWITAGLVAGKGFPDCDTFREVKYKAADGIWHPLRSIQEEIRNSIAARLLS